MYCHTWMEIDRVFIGFVIYPSLVGITAATWGAWKICSPPGLEGVCYWAISPQDLMFTCSFHLHHFPERNTKRIVFDIIQIFSSSTGCHFLNPYKNVNEYRIDTFPPILTRPTAGVTLSWWKSWKAKSHCAPLRCSRTGRFLGDCLKGTYGETNQQKKTIQGALAASWEFIYDIYIYTNCLGRIWSCIICP